MPPEQHTPNTSVTPPAKTNPLFTVTPLSKALAMLLFIALPFLGFWLGMGYGGLTQDSEETQVPEKRISHTQTTSAPLSNEQLAIGNATNGDDHSESMPVDVGYEVFNDKIHQFHISYPVNFKLVTTSDSGLYQGGSVFKSPDGEVEFFVSMSAVEGGNAEYFKPTKEEKLINEEQKLQDVSFGDYTSQLTRWTTYQALDGSYTRSATIIKRILSAHADVHAPQISYVFGYKYKDQQAYTKYLNEYLAFKKSFVIDIRY